MTPPRFVTDLNGRERRRYADQLRSTGHSLLEAADALLVEDDVKAMVEVVMASIGSVTTGELLVIFRGAAEAAQLADSLEKGRPTS